ncbi:carbohydrate ABC transporter permease [Cohnella abietis]|uniref:Sugar ABC transporter permease n=1 Tax=Cohnella abietis TaxID=2507935 RepID=A0A3T1D1M2_9BACL|nr:carbohydrate ABC transporter permease [Cohnella abietis]BBI31984.1 sugar ABC transporter permease [Cohnella abietis]
MVESNKSFQVVAHTIMALLSLFCLLPFVLLIVSSITNEAMLIRDGYSFFPRSIDFSAYKYLLFDSGNVLRGYGISILVAIVGTLVSLVLTTLFAYPLARKNLPGKGPIAFFLFFTMLFNGGLVPSYIMWTQTFGIKNTIWALIVPNLLMAAFNVILMRTYFTTNVPEAVIEAAKIDGAGEFRTLLNVVLPMSLPVISTLALLVGLGYWNDWLNGLYYINKDNLYSIQVLLNKMLLDTQFLKSTAAAGMSIDTSKIPSISIRMAVAVMGTLPIIIAYPFFQRFFIKGISIGAVKG